MTEITKVPLPPIAKGALTKLWLGVAAVALAAGGVAWATLPPSVDVNVVKAGTGPKPTMADVAIVKIKGTLTGGKVFQPEAEGPLPLSRTIPGFQQALLKMQKGGKYKISIPWELGYGPEETRNPQTGEVEIPAKSTLHFDIELKEFMPEAQFEQMMQMRQMMEGQGGGAPGGAPGGPAGGPPAGAGAPPKGN